MEYEILQCPLSVKPDEDISSQNETEDIERQENSQKQSEEKLELLKLLKKIIIGLAILTIFGLMLWKLL